LLLAEFASQRARRVSGPMSAASFAILLIAIAMMFLWVVESIAQRL
jgi:hypothetical protein